MCVLVAGGTVKCWGYNVYGQLGDESQSDGQIPVVVAGLTNVAAVSNGEHFSCAVITGGTVKCWGYNGYGQLGDGTDVNRSAPVSVANLTNVVSISLGYAHACAIITGGTVKCWGFNGNGQLGDGTTIGEGPTGNNNKTPTEVTGLTGAQSLSLGTLHSCAVITGGAVKCWGDNTLGELGNTTNISSSTPAAVSGLSGVLSISASRPYGGSHTCAVITGGTLKCWGINEERQLGDGSLINRNTPVLVPGLTGVSSVSSGYRHTCVVLTDGTARCWGSNTYGQIGDGTITNRAAPVAVSSLTGVASISSGNMHTCALLADATMKCWGGSSYGQLGDGMGWATSPVNVPFNSSPPATTVPVTTVPVTTVPATTVPATTTTTATTATTVPTSNVIGIPVPIRKMPTSAVAQRAEVGVNKTKVMVLLVTPKATKPINQVTKYIVQLKPKSGSTITKTINVRSGATVKPTLIGKKKVTYALTVTAVTKGGKMTSWKGPSVKTS
jgi:alpha-tubulin suppressor-like RCC1 family protein